MPLTTTCPRMVTFSTGLAPERTPARYWIHACQESGPWREHIPEGRPRESGNPWPVPFRIGCGVRIPACAGRDAHISKEWLTARTYPQLHRLPRKRGRLRERIG